MIYPSLMLALLLLFRNFPSAYAMEELQAIEVSGSKEVLPFHFGASSIFLKEELSDSSLGLSYETISESPGVTMIQSGGPGGRVSFFIRGTESRHVSFTIDGLKINDPSSIGRQFDSAFITSAFLKDLTVHKGPQAVLFGSDAMGGLIEMNSRKGEDAPETRLNVNAGSFGTLGSSLSHDWKNKQNRGTLTATKFRTDGISRLNKKRHGASERDGTVITQLTSSSQHLLKSKWTTDILGSWLRGHNELDGAGDDNSHDESKNDQYLAQQKTAYELDSNSAISLRNGVSRHQRSIDQLASGVANHEGELYQHEFLYETESPIHHVILGMGTERETYETLGIDKSFDLYSTFLQTLRKIDTLHLQAGVRVERHTSFGAFQTGSLGIKKILGAQALSLQYSEGFKAPSLYQLYAPSNVGNKNLEPERNQAWEARWEADHGALKTEISLFQNRLSDLISYIDSIGYRNQGDFMAEGIEANGTWTHESFRLTSSFMHQSFRQEETPVLGRPYNQASLSGTYFPKESIELGSKLKWFDSRKDFGPVKLNGFETVDLTLKIFHLKSEYGFQLVNVFDREYEESFGYSVMPRSVFLTYGHKFN